MYLPLEDLSMFNGGTYRVGIVGSGFIGRGLALALENVPDLGISGVVTRSNLSERSDYPFPELLTHDLGEVMRSSDLIVECTGDVAYATEVIDEVMRERLPVVTMDAEVHVTTGSYLAGRGLLTEAEGDQPGCLAAFRENVLQMGFTPLVYGNIKRFLNHHPTLEEMQFWSKKQGISLPQVTAFTDGTKVQIEQALVANGLQADIAVSGLLGIESNDITDGAHTLADGARRLERPISDYVLSPNAPAGVFIAAEHDEGQRDYLQYLKLGDGPYYILVQNFHLCHLEIQKTIRRILRGGDILLNNTTTPRISVAAVAKKKLEAGTCIDRGIGSFEVRGECVRIAENPEHVPIGLLNEAVVQREIEPGARLTMEDVELPDNLATRAWHETLSRVLEPATEARVDGQAL